MHRVCLVGAGNISRMHAQALACTPTAEAVAVCDPNAARAQALADEYGLRHVFGSLEQAIASETFDRAHVLVPPDLHASVAHRLLAARIGVLVEKPLAVSVADCTALIAQAERLDVPLAVNHNAVFYPAYLELRDRIRELAYGPLQHLTVVWNVSGQALPPAAHWSMQRPQNLAFETAVHPFSQVYDLAGPVLSADASFAGGRQVGAGQQHFDTWMVSMECERATAQVCVSYAGSYRLWQLVAICEDGVLTVEVEQNRITAVDRGRRGRYWEPLHHAAAVAAQEAEQAVGNVARQVSSTLRPTENSDPYFTSMRDSIAAFHGGSAVGRPRVDGVFGRDVVSICEVSSDAIATDAPRPLAPRRVHRLERCDVLVTGGTGFIGSELVEQIVASGGTVRVLARHTRGLPDRFYDRAIELVEGDVGDADAVARAVRGARTVAHLATGDPSDFDSADASIVRATEQLAQACLREGVERLVFTGTIASLYLGDANQRITGATPVDPRIRERGAYAWAKARAEQLLYRHFREQQLSICIVRPGVVLGAGGTPFHSGFGIWRGAVHCVGWNDGTNPLPLVLVSDVASAIDRCLHSAEAAGKTYNLVGDVRPCARECVEELRATLERPLVFHPMHPAQHQALEISKWLLRGAIRRQAAALPSYRAVKSMGCVAQFDCSDVKAELGWAPVADRSEFIALALRVHGRRPAARPPLPAVSAQHG